MTGRYGAHTFVRVVIGIAMLAVPAAAQQKPVGITAADVHQLDGFSRTLESFEQAVDTARQKSATKTDVDRVKGLGEQVKREAASYETQQATLVARIKSAGGWTPEFDAQIERGFQKGGYNDAITRLRAVGGARALLERRTAGTDTPQAIDDIVGKLHPPSAVSGLLQQLLGVPVECAFDRYSVCDYYVQMAAFYEYIGNEAEVNSFMAKYFLCVKVISLF